MCFNGDVTEAEADTAAPGAWALQCQQATAGGQTEGTLTAVAAMAAVAGVYIHVCVCVCVCVYSVR